MKYALAILILLFSSVVFAGPKEAMQASCRISSGGGTGTGIVFKQDSQYYYILTAGHVMDNSETFSVEFFKNGSFLPKIPAVKEFSSFVVNTYDDIGVIKVETRYFTDFKPRIIPVVDKNFQPKVGMQIYGAGCPNGFWLQAWEAKLHFVGDIIGFNMPPVGGQSGSGVCVNINGKDYVIGLVNWRYEPFGQKMYGGGVLIHNTKKTSVSNILESYAVPTSQVCRICGLTEKYHDIQKDKNGNIIVDENNLPVLFCRKCKHHGLCYKKHKTNGVDAEPCLLYFGIGIGRTRPQPYQPLPWNQPQPNNPGGGLPWEQPNQPEQPQPNNPGNELPWEQPEEPQPQQPEEPKSEEPVPKDPEEPEQPVTPPVQSDGVSTKTTILTGIGTYLLGLMSTFVTKKFGRIPGKLFTWYAKSKGIQLIEKLEKKTSKVVEKPVDVEYNTPEQPVTPITPPLPPPPAQEIQPASPVTNNIYNYNSPIPPYFKEFMDHKAKDGEKIEDWALFGVLYKEAVNLLRDGRLFFNVKDGVPLQGQEKTADLIDDWVKEQYIKRSSVQQVMTKNALYHEAMLGFLYKEAVTELRKGEFRVLGAEDTANTIDRWVRNEFLRRVNIK